MASRGYMSREFEKNQISRPRFDFFQIGEETCHNGRVCRQRRSRGRGPRGAHLAKFKPHPPGFDGSMDAEEVVVSGD